MAQEAIHTIQKCTSKAGAMALKINLAKANDKVDWHFFQYTFKAFGFPNHYMRLIMNCVSETALSNLWNKEKLPKFQTAVDVARVTPYPLIFLCCV